MKKIIFGLIGMSVVLLADFSRDNTKEVVLDSQTCLMWQDNKGAKNGYHEWEDALDYCNNLDLGGYTNWRLPNMNEAITILNFPAESLDNTYYDYINQTFKNVRSEYWTSTKSYWGNSSGTRWIINYGTGIMYGNLDEKSNMNVRCVRNK